MAVDLYWDDDAQTRLLCEFSGRWTWDELHAVMGTIQQLTAASPNTISAIVDARGVLNFSAASILNRGSLEQAKALLRLGAQGTGPLVIVGSNPLFRTAHQLLLQFDSKALASVYFAESQEAARELLAALPPL